MLPDSVRAEVAAQLGARVRQESAVGGGCISPAYRVWLESGACIFVKLQPATGPVEILWSEADALDALQATESVRVPRVLARGDDWLALEWLEPARATAADWTELGRALARLHRKRAGTFGWDRDNYIGTLPQDNTPSPSWPEFWRVRRLEPQRARAAAAFDDATRVRFELLYDRLDDMLRPGDEEGASLLHGDLWNGNVHMTALGPAVIDPSSYYGHREVDLAMAALFGGFPPDFFAAYEAEWPLLSGADRRRHVDQLYYLLVHVNLFGRAYTASTATALAAALA